MSHAGLLGIFGVMAEHYPPLRSTLLGKLDDHRAEVRCAALNGLKPSATANPEVYAAIEARLQDADRNIRVDALKILSLTCGNPAVKRSLALNALTDRSADARSAAVGILRDFFTRRSRNLYGSSGLARRFRHVRPQGFDSGACPTA